MPLVRYLTALALWAGFDHLMGGGGNASIIFFVLVTLVAAVAQPFDELPLLLWGYGKFNPRYWHHDEFTDEYYPVTLSNSEGYLYDFQTHQDRLIHKIKTRSEMDGCGSFALLLAVIILFSVISGKSASVVWLVFYGISLVCLCCYDFAMIGHHGDPPPPGTPASARLVEQQKAHGEGRWLTPEEINLSSDGAATAGSFDDYKFPT